MHDRDRIPEGEVRPLGDRAFLIGVVDPAAGRALAEQLRAALGGAAEVVGGAATVMVHATDAAASSPALRARSQRWTPSRVTRRRGPGAAGRHRAVLVTVPCRFDGPDLDEVAAQAGCAAGRGGGACSRRSR